MGEAQLQMCGVKGCPRKAERYEQCKKGAQRGVQTGLRRGEEEVIQDTTSGAL